jgi:hypothetical protein
MGSRKESCPPITWTESGQTPVLTESSSSRTGRTGPQGHVVTPWSATRAEPQRGRSSDRKFVTARLAMLARDGPVHCHRARHLVTGEADGPPRREWIILAAAGLATKPRKTACVSARVSAMPRLRGAWHKPSDLRKRSTTDRSWVMNCAGLGAKLLAGRGGPRLAVRSPQKRPRARGVRKRRPAAPAITERRRGIEEFLECDATRKRWLITRRAGGRTDR